jgi:hypothetical protein
VNYKGTPRLASVRKPGTIRKEKSSAGGGPLSAGGVSGGPAARHALRALFSPRDDSAVADALQRREPFIDKLLERWLPTTPEPSAQRAGWLAAVVAAHVRVDRGRHPTRLARWSDRSQQRRQPIGARRVHIEARADIDHGRRKHTVADGVLHHGPVLRGERVEGTIHPRRVGAGIAKTRFNAHARRQDTTFGHGPSRRL